MIGQFIQLLCSTSLWLEFAAVLYDTWEPTSRAAMPGAIRVWTERSIRPEGTRIVAYSNSTTCINKLYIQYPMGERMGQIINLRFSKAEIPHLSTNTFASSMRFRASSRGGVPAACISAATASTCFHTRRRFAPTTLEASSSLTPRFSSSATRSG